VRDLLLIVGLALASSGAVALIGALVLRVMRGRSVLIHVTTLLVVTVASVLAGVIAVAQAMFISAHDLQALLVVLTAASLASLVVVLAVGRRLGRPVCGRPKHKHANGSSTAAAAKSWHGSPMTCAPPWPGYAR
jgi:hypothetical protein